MAGKILEANGGFNKKYLKKCLIVRLPDGMCKITIDQSPPLAIINRLGVPSKFPHRLNLEGLIEHCQSRDILHRFS